MKKTRLFLCLSLIGLLVACSGSGQQEEGAGVPDPDPQADGSGDPGGKVKTDGEPDPDTSDEQQAASDDPVFEEEAFIPEGRGSGDQARMAGEPDPEAAPEPEPEPEPDPQPEPAPEPNPQPEPEPRAVGRRPVAELPHIQEARLSIACAGSQALTREGQTEVYIAAAALENLQGRRFAELEGLPTCRLTWDATTLGLEVLRVNVASVGPDGVLGTTIDNRMQASRAVPLIVGPESFSGETSCVPFRFRIEVLAGEQVLFNETETHVCVGERIYPVGVREHGIERLSVNRHRDAGDEGHCAGDCMQGCSAQYPFPGSLQNECMQNGSCVYQEDCRALAESCRQQVRQELSEHCRGEDNEQDDICYNERDDCQNQCVAREREGEACQEAHAQDVEHARSQPAVGPKPIGEEIVVGPLRQEAREGTADEPSQLVRLEWALPNFFEAFCIAAPDRGPAAASTGRHAGAINALNSFASGAANEAKILKVKNDSTILGSTPLRSRLERGTPTPASLAGLDWPVTCYRRRGLFDFRSLLGSHAFWPEGGETKFAFFAVGRDGKAYHYEEHIARVTPLEDLEVEFEVERLDPRDNRLKISLEMKNLDKGILITDNPLFPGTYEDRNEYSFVYRPTVSPVSSDCHNECFGNETSCELASLSPGCRAEWNNHYDDLDSQTAWDSRWDRERSLTPRAFDGHNEEWPDEETRALLLQYGREWQRPIYFYRFDRREDPRQRRTLSATGDGAAEFVVASSHYEPKFVFVADGWQAGQPAQRVLRKNCRADLDDCAIPRPTVTDFRQIERDLQVGTTAMTLKTEVHHVKDVSLEWRDPRACLEGREQTTIEPTRKSGLVPEVNEGHNVELSAFDVDVTCTYSAEGHEVGFFFEIESLTGERISLRRNGRGYVHIFDVGAQLGSQYITTRCNGELDHQDEGACLNGDEKENIWLRWNIANYEGGPLRLKKIKFVGMQADCRGFAGGVGVEGDEGPGSGTVTVDIEKRLNGIFSGDENDNLIRFSGFGPNCYSFRVFALPQGGSERSWDGAPERNPETGQYDRDEDGRVRSGDWEEQPPFTIRPLIVEPQIVEGEQTGSDLMDCDTNSKQWLDLRGKNISSVTGSCAGSSLSWEAVPRMGRQCWRATKGYLNIGNPVNINDNATIQERGRDQQGVYTATFWACYSPGNGTVGYEERRYDGDDGQRREIPHCARIHDESDCRAAAWRDTPVYDDEGNRLDHWQTVGGDGDSGGLPGFTSPQAATAASEAAAFAATCTVTVFGEQGQEITLEGVNNIQLESYRCDDTVRMRGEACWSCVLPWNW